MKKLRGKFFLTMVMLLAVCVTFQTVALATEEEEEDIVITGYNNDETQVISYMGKFSESSVKNQNDALKVIGEVEKELGLEDADSELEYLTTEDYDGSLNYVFQQIYKEHNVFGSRVSVTALEDGTVDSLESTLCATAILNKLDMTPAISAEEAEEIAKKDYGKDCTINSDKTRMVIYPQDDTAKLVYYVSVQGESDGENASTMMLVDTEKEVIDKISDNDEEYDIYDHSEDYDIYEGKYEFNPLPIILACAGGIVVIAVVVLVVIKVRKSAKRNI
ncbi:MAG: hypothetical protein UH239_10290 [Acutalibacteraceae bacterium]|nr:hypothetical protein [Acutalibacteraceae bacterium]